MQKDSILDSDFIILDLIVIAVPLVSILWLLIYYHFIWRKKYYDKKTGWYKCGVCGKTPSNIYFRNGIFFTKYHCLEHSKNENKNIKNEI